jgi:hypothetical protein
MEGKTMTAQIINFESRVSSTVSADKQYLWSVIGDDKPFANLSFVSRERNEYGWPDSFWKVRPPEKKHGGYDEGARYARELFDAISAGHGSYRASRYLQGVLEAIILEQAKLRSMGGKGSRSVSATIGGFLQTISDLMTGWKS